MNYQVLKRKREHAVSLLKRMVSIRSSNPHVSDQDETELAGFLREELEGAGLHVDLQQVTSEYPRDFVENRTYTRPNVIARMGKKGGVRLILNGHLDTVAANTMKRAFRPRVVADRLYGRGSSDMKGGIASIVAAAEAVQESDLSLEGELVLSLVVDEETIGQGTMDFLKRQRGDFVIVAEPTENTLGIAQAGYIYFNVLSRGESRHGQTTIPQDWSSAFVQATNLCNRILEDRFLIRKKRVQGVEMETTFNFSPTKYTPPSSYAWMTMEEFRVDCLLGLIPESTAAMSLRSSNAAMRRIEKLVYDANRNGQRSKIGRNSMNIGFIQKENSYTKAFEKAMAKVLGHHKRSYVLSFCDATHFYRANMPTILFGPGRMSLGHSSEEYTSVSQVKDATSVFAYEIESILACSTS